MTVKEFRDEYVKITYINDHDGLYGMFPARIHIEHPLRKDFNEAVPFRGTEQHYQAIKLAMIIDPTVLYLALDFPSGGDIKSDFVIIFFVLDGKADCFAIPYNNKTGEIYDDIFPQDYRQLQEILIQFKHLTGIH